VVFTFEGMQYGRPEGATQDLSQIQFIFNGKTNTPVAVSNEIQSVSYLISVDGAKEYTLTTNSFLWPTISTNWVDVYVDPYDPFDDYTAWCTNTYHTLTWTNFHNGKVGTPECVIDPEWHHLLPQKSTLKPFFENIQKPDGSYVNIDDAEFGWILDLKDHRSGDGLHNIAGSNGKKWIEEWEAWKKAKPTRTWEELQTQLNKLKADGRFKQVLDRGKQAAHSYSAWGGNQAAREEFILLLAAERGTKVVKYVRKSGRVVGRVIRRGAAIAGFVLIVVDVASAQDASQVVEKIKDNAPGTGDYRMAEEILNELGYYDFWGQIGHILGLLQTPQELYNQHLENIEKLWGTDTILTPASILPWN